MQAGLEKTKMEENFSTDLDEDSDIQRNTAEGTSMIRTNIKSISQYTFNKENLK